MITENTYESLCRLLGAWVNGTAAALAETLDFEALFQTASKHLLSAAVCAALESVGLMDACPAETARRFRDAMTMAVRRTILMDAERKTLLDFFEKSGIWYLPLKGVVLNGYYPQYGTRQFADNDILFDAARWREVRNFMMSRGYKAKSVGKGAHDTYHKPPIYNFELHRLLFTEGDSPFLTTAAAYYSDVKARLIKDEDNRFGYHFSDEDIFVYFLVHAYKHYGVSGTGLRTLLDLYLYRLAKPDMDGAYIEGELEKLGLGEFGALFRSLGEKLFGPAPCPALTEKERETLDRVEGSGVYGTTANRVHSWLQSMQGDGGVVTARTRVRYLFWRLFPGREWYRANAPFVYRHRCAVPFFWAYRLCRGVLRGRRSLREVGIVCARRGQ